jgi:hypothetical protein
MAIETSIAGVTVSAAEPETLPIAAVMVADPGAAEVARPFEPDALLIDAVFGLDEIQVTVEVRFFVEPSL